jgi:hypothetical protein
MEPAGEILTRIMYFTRIIRPAEKRTVTCFGYSVLLRKGGGGIVELQVHIGSSFNSETEHIRAASSL